MLRSYEYDWITLWHWFRLVVSAAWAWMHVYLLLWGTCIVLLYFYRFFWFVFKIVSIINLRTLDFLLLISVLLSLLFLLVSVIFFNLSMNRRWDDFFMFCCLYQFEVGFAWQFFVILFLVFGQQTQTNVKECFVFKL